MDVGPNQRVALLSIHPGFADAILRGDKRVEFRRRGPSSSTTHVIVYATAPVSKVVGWFSVDSIDSDAPATLWDRYGEVGGIDEAAFRAYYDACQVGSAIRVRHANALATPVGLEDLEPGSKAPQSFRYVASVLLDALGTYP